MPPWLAKLLASLREPISIKDAAPAHAKAKLEQQEKSDREAREKKEARDVKPGEAIRDLLLKGGIAVVAALGLAGSVAVVGGAILWIRFSEARLPANQALQVVPDDQLVIAGAAALVGGSLAALAGIVVIFALDPRGQVTKGSVVGLCLLLIGGVIYAAAVADLRVLQVIGLAIGGVVLAAACLGIAERTKVSFLPFGAAVFLSVMVFAAVLSLFIAHERAEVQPAAVLRSPDDDGITGIYVTDTPEHIYIGRWQRKGDKRALFRIERGEQTQLAIGASVPQGEAARAQARGLLRRLQLDARKLANAPQESPRATER